MSIWKRIDNFGFRTFGNVARWLCRLTGVSSKTLGTFLLHVWFMLDAGYWTIPNHSLGTKLIGVFTTTIAFAAIRFASERFKGDTLVYALKFPRVYGMVYLATKIVFHCIDPSDHRSMIITGAWTVGTLAIYALSLDIPKQERKEWVWGPKPKTA